MAYRSQRIALGAASPTYTVIDAKTFMPLPPVDDYLRFLEQTQASPHTIRSYASALAGWFTYLDFERVGWDAFPVGVFGNYLDWVRAGGPPLGQARIGTVDPTQPRAASTVKLRAAAVFAFYRWQAAANGLDKPLRALYSPLPRQRHRPYTPLLEGIAPDSGPEPIYRVRAGPRGRTPLLLPQQVRAIVDGCATQRSDGTWTGGPAALRNRLLFALLAESGMRLGEALGLRHSDIVPGRGRTPAIDIRPRQDHPHGARVKSGQPRRVYVGDDLEALYGEYVWSLVDAQMDLVIADISQHFVFVNVTSNGTQFAPIRPENVYSTVRSLTRKHGDVLPTGWTPHWLRHTHATALLLSGCPPHVVMRRLGHLDVQTTLSTYGWVTEDAELRAVADWRSYAAGWREVLS